MFYAQIFISIIWECRLCKFVRCNYDACASIFIIWFIILTRLVACPFTCTLYLLLALLCVAWCTSARLLIFLFPTSGAIQASNFCHVGQLSVLSMDPKAPSSGRWLHLELCRTWFCYKSSLGPECSQFPDHLWLQKVRSSVTRLTPVPTEGVTNYRVDVTWSEGELCHCQAPPERKHRKSPVPRYQRLFGPLASSLYTCTSAFAPVLLLCAIIAFVGWKIAIECVSTTTISRWHVNS